LGLRFALSQRTWMPRRLLATKLTGNFFPAVMRGGARVLGVFEKLLHPRLVRVFEPGYVRFLAGAVICQRPIRKPAPSAACRSRVVIGACNPRGSSNPRASASVATRAAARTRR
ncbi:MAG: hypothetical protein EB018_06435, partial [Gammaproteobacteria bacterium]|nr:hypothetical protein [Gammaproteobacteria bacterium]